MNKALLIIICDFLLLSLLSLANFDKALEDREEEKEAEPVPDMTTSQSDLMEALQAALEEEKNSREELESQLEETLDQVKSQEELLAEREASLQNVQEDLSMTEQRAQLLEQERQALDAQITDTVRNLIDLEEQLNDAELKTEVSNAKLLAMQSELVSRERAAQELKSELEKVEQQQQATEEEKQQLALNLKEVETERNIVREQLTVTRQQVEQVQQEKEILREEKAQVMQTAEKLADGVGALAEKSTELQEEIRESRPLTGNEIFSGFITNRLETEFTARKTGFLGPSGDTEKTQSVLISKGDKTYMIYHSQNTLLNLKSGETSWEYIYAHIRRGFTLISMETVNFLQSDPRVVLAEITPEQVEELGVQVYPLADEPYKFSEAVLVGGSGEYYGESPFQIDARAPKYVKMEKGQFRKFFGNFAPSRGDLVFSKTGKVLGIMVNNEYCMVLDDLTIADEVTLGPKIQNAENAKVLSNMAFRVSRLPIQVQ